MKHLVHVGDPSVFPDKIAVVGEILPQHFFGMLDRVKRGDLILFVEKAGYLAGFFPELLHPAFIRVVLQDAAGIGSHLLLGQLAGAHLVAKQDRHFPAVPFPQQALGVIAAQSLIGSFVLDQFAYAGLQVFPWVGRFFRRADGDLDVEGRLLFSLSLHKVAQLYDLCGCGGFLLEIRRRPAKLLGLLLQGFDTVLRGRHIPLEFGGILQLACRQVLQILRKHVVKAAAVTFADRAQHLALLGGILQAFQEIIEMREFFKIRGPFVEVLFPDIGRDQFFRAAPDGSGGMTGSHDLDDLVKVDCLSAVDDLIQAFRLSKILDPFIRGLAYGRRGSFGDIHSLSKLNRRFFLESLSGLDLIFLFQPLCFLQITVYFKEFKGLPESALRS